MAIKKWLHRHKTAVLTFLIVAIVGLGVGGYFTVRTIYKTSPCAEKAKQGTIHTGPMPTAEDDYQEAVLWGTQGLPIGQTAPGIAGVDFAEEPTVLVFTKKPDRSCAGCPLFSTLLGQATKEINHLQFVVVASGEDSGTWSETLNGSLGEQVTVLTDPLEQIRESYRLYRRPSGITFLIDQSSTIVARLRNLTVSNQRDWLQTVRHFALHGHALEGDLVLQHPMNVLDRPVSLFFSLENMHGQPAVLDSLLGITSAASVDNLMNVRELANQYSDDLPSEFYEAQIPTDLQGFINKIEIEKENIIHYAEEYNLPFPIFLDWDDKVQHAWGMGLYGVPALAFLDAEGKLVKLIPCLMVSENIDETIVDSVYPTLPQLRQILEEVFQVHRSSTSSTG